MAVDDLWYLKTKGSDGKRLPTRRHGRGKRWRVRWEDPETGKPRTELFERKPDADARDAELRSDIQRGRYIDPRAGQVTVAEYVEQWRHQQLHEASTAQRIENQVRKHVVPVLGQMQLRQVRSSHIKHWVKDRSTKLEPSTLRVIYTTCLVAPFRQAVIDRLIGSTPCMGIQLPELDGRPYFIPTAQQVYDLADALDERYRPIPLLAAGCGWRASEIFGAERNDDPSLNTVDFLRREAHVRQQVRVVIGRRPHLVAPKTQLSRRTNELPDVVGEALARHLERFPPVTVVMDDETNPRKAVRRPVKLLFTTARGGPLTTARWAYGWPIAVAKVGLPKGFGLHGLRHYFATVLIHGGTNVKSVQLAMGHSKPTVTLDTYTGYWPDAVDTTRSLLNAALTLGEEAVGEEVADS